MTAFERRLTTIGLCIGAFFLLSTVLYAFTGMGLWAPEPSTGEFQLMSARQFVLFIVHLLGIVAGAASVIARIESK